MRTVKYVLFVAAALFSVSTLAFAHRGQGGCWDESGCGGHGGCWGARQGGMTYGPATEVTLAGTVDEVKHMPAPANGPGGLHLIVRNEAGALEVVLGPAAFITAKDFEFVKGDAISVTGSKAKRAGQEVIIAREIAKGDRVLTLRDANGFPLWSGRCWR